MVFNAGGSESTARFIQKLPWATRNGRRVVFTRRAEFCFAEMLRCARYRSNESLTRDAIRSLLHSILIRKHVMRSRRMLALGLILNSSVLLAATLPPVEPMPTLDAATLAPAALLNGAGYTVDANAPVIGYMGQFTLNAPAGTFRA